MLFYMEKLLIVLSSQSYSFRLKYLDFEQFLAVLHYHNFLCLMFTDGLKKISNLGMG